MHKRNRQIFTNPEQFFIDFLALLSAYLFSYWVSSYLTFLLGITDYIWVACVFIPVFLFHMNMRNMYNRTTFNYVDRIFRNVVLSAAISGFILTAIIFFAKQLDYSRIFVGLFVICSLLFVLAGRFAYLYLAKFNNWRGMSKRVVIVGTGEVIDKFEYFLGKTNLSLNVIGYIPMPGHPDPDVSPILGELDYLKQIITEHAIDEVVFAVPHYDSKYLEYYINLCEKLGVTACVVLNLYDLKLSKVHLAGIGTLPMLTFHTVSLNEIELLIKRVLDIMGAVVGLMITGIASLFIIPMIKLDSKGPIFFKQKRVGQHGRVFLMYKFRTMYVDAEERKNELMNRNKMQGGFMFKMDDDPRITRVGKLLRKTSLDELPQFINVLKGEMSMVGTRPPTLDEVKKYKLHHYRRISIKPGLTGMWQIAGRSDIRDFDEVVRLDTEYIDCWSVWLDIKIILRTILVVMFNKGAY